MAKQFVRRPVSWAVLRPQARLDPGDEAELRRLGRSLRSRQIHPVVARPDGTVIDGERRVRAALLDGLEELDFIVTDEALTPAEVTEIQFVSAWHREDLTGYEQWRALLAIRAARPDATHKALAELLNIDPTMVRVILSPGDCIPEVQQALLGRRIPLSACDAIARVPAEQQAELLQLKLSGASRDEIARLSRRRRNGSASAAAVRVARIRITLASGIQVTVAGEGLDLENTGDALAEARKEVRKAVDDNLDARTAQAVWRDRAKAST